MLRIALFLFLFMLVEYNLFLWCYHQLSNNVGISEAFWILLASQIYSGYWGIRLVRIHSLTQLLQSLTTPGNQQRVTSDIIKSLFTLVAGILLIIPGIFSDTMGIIFLTPKIQNFCANFVSSKIKHLFSQTGGFSNSGFTQSANKSGFFYSWNTRQGPKPPSSKINEDDQVIDIQAEDEEKK